MSSSKKSASKKSEMGIGTLILFIALILVAAIAAGVLIQTAVSLQSRALETGRRSTSEVGTALKTVLLYGEDASVNRTIHDIRQQIKLVAGSDPIKLSDSVITLDLDNSSQEYLYERNTTCENATGQRFRARYIQNGTSHIQGYIASGDVVELCYRSPRYIREDESMRVNFIPKVGSVMSISLMTSSIMISRKILLYP
jgi:flagellin-like protein